MIEIQSRNDNEYYIRYVGKSMEDFLNYSEVLGNIQTKYFDFVNNLWITDSVSAQKIQDKFNNPDIGKHLKLKPYGYQRQAVKACLDTPGKLIQLSCGAGKTAIGLCILDELIRDKKLLGPAIFVVKASLKSQWYDEVSKFTDYKANIIETYKKFTSNISSKIKSRETKIKKMMSESSKSTMKYIDEIAALQEEIDKLELEKEESFINQFSIKDYNIFILNYETFADERVKEELHKLDLQFFFIDEIDCIKDPKTKRNKNLVEFKDAKYKYGATATPIRKNPKDLYGIFSFLVPDLFKSEVIFENNYCKKWMGRITGSKNEKQLMEQVYPYKFTRTFDQIADQLPEQIIIPQICYLSQKQIEKTNELLNEIDDFKKQQEALAEHLTPEQLVVHPEYERLNGLIAARQTFAQMLADSEELLENSNSNAAKQYITNTHSSKIELCLELVERIVNSGEKVCIFSRYLGVQDILKREINKINFDISDNVRIAQIYGSISDDERHKILQDYNNSNDCNILLLSDAGEAGLNLSSTKYMIEFDLADSAAKQTQRHGRIQRADSVHKNVIVYQLIAKDSYDEIALRIIAKKAQYANKIL